MTRIANTSIKDAAFQHRRTILGFQVLVNGPSESLGLTREEFAVRIKRPTGAEDYIFSGHYYWQAFNDARKRILKTATI